MVDVPWIPGVIILLSGVFIVVGTRFRWKIVRMPSWKWTEWLVTSRYLFGFGFMIAGMIIIGTILVWW